MFQRAVIASLNANFGTPRSGRANRASQMLQSEAAYSPLHDQRRRPRNPPGTLVLAGAAAILLPVARDVCSSVPALAGFVECGIGFVINLR